MSDFYLDPDGFLGTGASLLADFALLAYIFLIVPAMLVGFVFARRKMFRPYHKYTMITITVVNFVLIFFLMLVAYDYDVADNIGDKAGNSRYLLPTIHAVLGTAAQLLAVSNIYRILREEYLIREAKKRGETSFGKYYANNIKLPMRLTLALWLITASLGIATYLTRYEVIPTFGDEDEPAPIVTPEVTEEPLSTAEAAPDSTAEAAPNATQEAGAPVATEAAPQATEEDIAPLATEAIAPVSTEEAGIEIAAATPEVGAPIATEAVAIAETSEPQSTAESVAPVATEEVAIAVTVEPQATAESVAPVATEAVAIAVTSEPQATPEPLATPEVTPEPLGAPAGIEVDADKEADYFVNAIPLEWRTPENGTPRYKMEIEAEETELERCRFDDGDVNRVRYDFEVVIEDLFTRKEIRRVFTGSEPEPCPATQTFTDDEDDIYNLGMPDVNEFSTWLSNAERILIGVSVSPATTPEPAPESTPEMTAEPGN